MVGYCSEEELLDLLVVAYRMHIDMANIPIVLVSSHPNSDLSIFSGTYFTRQVGTRRRPSPSRKCILDDSNSFRGSGSNLHRKK